MAYVDVGLSESTSVSNKSSAGAGDFSIGGGNKQSQTTQTLYIVAGLIAVLGIIAFVFLRKK